MRLFWPIKLADRLCTRGSRPITYPDTVTRNTGIRLEELAGAMADKTQWRIRVSSISTADDG